MKLVAFYLNSRRFTNEKVKEMLALFAAVIMAVTVFAGAVAANVESILQHK